MVSSDNLIVKVWVLAFGLSIALRFWGVQHPEPFHIRPFLVAGLLIVPSLLMGIWIFSVGFSNDDF